MPNVVLYVAAAKWKALESEGEDPATKVRQLAGDALDYHLAGSIEGTRATLSERGTTEASDGSEPGTPGYGSAERLSRPSTPRSESDHFKPDPKPEKRKR